MPNIISENDIEKAIIRMLTDQLGFRHINCYTADPNDSNDGTGRKNKSEVVFLDILREKAGSLNPGIPAPVVDEALAILTTIGCLALGGGGRGAGYRRRS